MSNELPMNELPDLEKFQNGDKNEFKKIFNMYNGPLVWLSDTLIDNRPAAEDIVADTFLALWEKRRAFNAVEQIRSFLYKTVKNNSFNYLRTRIMHLEKDMEYIAGLEKKWKEQAEREELLIKQFASLKEMLVHLSDGQRNVFILRVFQNKSYEDIALTLQISKDTAYTLFSQAIKKLRQILGTI